MIAGGYIERDITANGLRLHYLDWGTAGNPPLILLHGLSRTAHTYDHVAPHFTRDFHVLAVDLRGHGDSGWDAGGAYLVDDHVADIEVFAERLALRQITIAGNSTGGRVAQVFAARHPESVVRLIVEDVGPERPPEVAERFARRVQQDTGGWACEDDLLAQLRTETPEVPDALLRSHARFATRRREDGRLVWKRDPDLVKGFVPTELWDDVKRIACPTIYILGAKSPIVPRETQQQLIRVIPGVQVVLVPGVGHHPHLEAADTYLAIIDRFIAESVPA